MRAGLLALLIAAAPLGLAQDASAELARLAEADQADRRAFSAGEIPWDSVAAGDAARYARVEALLGADRLRTGADLYHAALVFQHGGAPFDFYRAYALARRASEAHGYDGARWLVPRAYDRWLQSIGRPQVYGTQFLSRPPDGHDLHTGGHDGDISGWVWSLGEADLDAVTDAERAVWGVRPAAETRAMLECLNQSGGDWEACAD